MLSKLLRVVVGGWVVISLCTGLWGGAAREVDAASPSLPGVQVLSSGPTGLRLEWTAPPFKVEPVGDGTVVVTAAEYPQIDEPGAPRVPFISSVIALPPGASPALTILSSRQVEVPLEKPVALVPYPAGMLRDEKGLPIGQDVVPAQSQTWTVPDPPVVLEEIGVMRGVRLARLSFYPFHPNGSVLRVVESLQAEVRWEDGMLAAARLPEDDILELLDTQVLNPEAVVPQRQLSGLDVGSQAWPDMPTAFVTVSAPGVYEVPYSAVSGYGFSGVNPANLRLFRGNEEVAGEVVDGGSPGVFDGGDIVRFYGEPRPSRWTTTDVYRLVSDSVSGLRMQTRSANPGGLPAGKPWVEQILEENHLYTPNCFCGVLGKGHDGDRWAWQDVKTGGTFSHSFTPTGVNNAAGASLEVWLIAYTSGTHQVRAYLNGYYLGQIAWTGKVSHSSVLTVPSGRLVTGVQNSLTLTDQSASNQGVWVDAFVLRYARSAGSAGTSLSFEGDATRSQYGVTLSASPSYRYDVTNPLQPQLLSDISGSGNTLTLGDPISTLPRRYFVATSVLATNIRAKELPGGTVPVDMMVIAHPNFNGAVGPLVTRRQDQGLSAATFNVLGIYDTWGDGRPDPQAIKAFVQNAYDTWPTLPAYVLLVGDGNYNPKGYQEYLSHLVPPWLYPPPSLIPPFLGNFDRGGGETAADNRYVCVDGADALPDLSIGRIPAQTPQQVTDVVNKIIFHENGTGMWTEQIELVADDTEDWNNFGASSDAHACEHLVAPFTATRRYCEGPDGAASDCPGATATAIHDGLRNDWNAGKFAIQFTGHSSWQQWAQESFLGLNDVPNLTNASKPPLVVAMTCFTGAFHRPEATLDMTLINRSGGGAATVWGSTGLGVTGGHDSLGDGFFKAILQDKVNRVGQAVLAAKLNLAAHSSFVDLLDTYTLFGDSAMVINRGQRTPEADLGLTKTSTPGPALQGGPITYMLVVDNYGTDFVKSITLTDDLPSGLSSWNYTASSGTYNPITGEWSGLYLDGGEHVTLTIAGTIKSTFTGELVNTASVSTAQATDPVPGNNSETDVNTVIASADLSVSLVSKPAPPLPGESIVYTITVNNTGPSWADMITLTVDAPALDNLTFTWDCGAYSCEDYDDETGAWVVPYFGAAGAMYLRAVGTIDPAFTQLPSITATVGTSEATDPNLDNNVVGDGEGHSVVYLPIIVKSR